MLIIREDILILGKDPAQGLDDTIFTFETEYSIDFTELGKKFCLRLHCNGSNSYLLEMKNSLLVEMH